MANPICVQESEHHPVSCSPNPSQISTGLNVCTLFIYFAVLALGIEILWTQSTSLEGGCVYTYAYTESASGADISSDSSRPAGV